jgi:hypothetical protein
MWLLSSTSCLGVGWSIIAAMTAQLVTDALVKSIPRHGKPIAASVRALQPVHQRTVAAAHG